MDHTKAQAVQLLNKRIHEDHKLVKITRISCLDERKKQVNQLIFSRRKDRPKGQLHHKIYEKWKETEFTDFVQVVHFLTDIIASVHCGENYSLWPIS